ncbi:putative long-chain-alcohol O-fatty-acyltransferase 2 [Dendrobium catenatum]|uniref:Putative long-chain-alcohol O-fatty-acyltransferase 2 n=1 Tax=Dendrobium catenatum TaxID=906689 RepID=A0A2I0X1W6_9ASPA|nr:putative long-chain-alcohol O-fatty-acyltransferase 2 [Dendrobium catenatum]
MEALLKVSASVAALIAYARFTASKPTPGCRRFVALLPAISPLLFLPLSFTSIHFRGITGFFLGWLAAFRFLHLLPPHLPDNLELVLSTAVFVGGSLLGLDLELQFNAPYLSTSLQDF